MLPIFPDSGVNGWENGDKFGWSGHHLSQKDRHTIKKDKPAKVGLV